MIEQRLERARTEYARKLQTYLQHLADLVEQARCGDEADVRRAQQLAHKICGSAGTFGFPEVGRAVAVIDSQLLPFLDRRLDDDPAWPTIEEALLRARDLMRRPAD